MVGFDSGECPAEQIKLLKVSLPSSWALSCLQASSFSLGNYTKASVA